MTTDVVIVGASDQGEVVLDIVRSLPSLRPIGFIDPGEGGTFIGLVVDGLRVLGGLDYLDAHRDSVAGGIPAIGDSLLRRKIAEKLDSLAIPMISAVHPTAIICGGTTIGKGSVIAAGAIIGVNATIGSAAIVNTGAIVDHHCTIGDFAHIAPGARLAGGVQIGEGTLVGIGATILDDVAVGSDATIAAGAVVTTTVRSGATVMGVPATERQRQP